MPTAFNDANNDFTCDFTIYITAKIISAFGIGFQAVLMKFLNQWNALKVSTSQDIFSSHSKFADVLEGGHLVLKETICPRYSGENDAI